MSKLFWSLSNTVGLFLCPISPTLEQRAGGLLSVPIQWKVSVVKNYLPRLGSNSQSPQKDTKRDLSERHWGLTWQKQENLCDGTRKQSVADSDPKPRGNHRQFNTFSTTKEKKSWRKCSFILTEGCKMYFVWEINSRSNWSFQFNLQAGLDNALRKPETGSEEWSLTSARLRCGANTQSYCKYQLGPLDFIQIIVIWGGQIRETDLAFFFAFIEDWNTNSVSSCTLQTIMRRDSEHKPTKSLSSCDLILFFLIVK